MIFRSAAIAIESVIDYPKFNQDVCQVVLSVRCLKKRRSVLAGRLEIPI